MSDTKPRTADGKVLFHFAMSLGIRLYDNPGREPIRLHRVGDSNPTSAVNVRYRPAT